MLLPDLFEIKGDKHEEDLKENNISSPSSLQYMAKKYREAKFMRVAGFVCKVYLHIF